MLSCSYSVTKRSAQQQLGPGFAVHLLFPGTWTSNNYSEPTRPPNNPNTEAKPSVCDVFDSYFSPSRVPTD